MQFLFAPLIGNLSDRYGRRPVLLASVLTFAIDNLICAVAWSYAMLFVGRVLAGISGRVSPPPRPTLPMSEVISSVAKGCNSCGLTSSK
jgi:MFS family permease